MIRGGHRGGAGREGHFVALAQNTPLVTSPGAGVLKVRHAGGTEARRPIQGGFFEVSNHRATVLADAITING